jgi:RecA-family ATPase
MAASIATGRPFLGHEVAEEGPVIYIAAEGAAGIRGRFEAWEYAQFAGAPIPDDRLTVVSGPVNLLDPEQVAELDELCAEVAPRLMVLDTMHRCAPGVEENSAKEMGQVIEVLSGLRERHDCTILADHHTGHGGQRSRGSSSIEDDFDNAWVIKLAGDGEDRSPKNQRTMEHRKVKDGELNPRIPIGLTPSLESA